MAEQHPPQGEERRESERRRRPTPLLSRYSWFGGQRRAARRGGEEQRVFVDLYSLRAWILLSTLLALNLVDAHFTLRHLQYGGEEANPLMRSLLGAGTVPFLAVKSLGVGLGVAVFCLLKNFRLARLGVLLLLVVYALLTLYHLWLVSGPPPG